MRILWIGKQPTSGDTGDEVFDRKTIGACRAAGHTVDLFHPEQVARWQEIGNLLRGLPYYRARFASRANIAAIHGKSSGYDVVICSWEPFDVLARGLSVPTILILHNVTSRALTALYPGNLLASLGAATARAWERRWYRSEHFATVAALSRKDLNYLEELEGRPKLALLPPGMPPCIKLATDASIRREIVISGTFEWRPKRRDILLFAQEYPAHQPGTTIRANNLPPEAAERLMPSPLPLPEESSAAIRFGLITDRFEAGHKLKTLAYIASNQIVLSLADVSFDFAHIHDNAFFIRRIQTVTDIAAHLDAVAAEPAQILRERFLAFQQACARAFTWDAVATALMNAATTAPFPPRSVRALG